MPGASMIKSYNNQSSFGQSYIYGNPEITYWKAAYRRHTNFAIEAREMTNSSTTAAWGTEVVYKIPRDQSDLMYKVHLDATLPDPDDNKFFCAYPAQRLVEWAEFKIGGTSISGRLTSDFLHCWHELTIPESKKWAYRELIGHTKSVLVSHGGASVTLPLPFWFTENPGVAFPRNAITNDEVSIVIKYRATDKICRNTNPAATSQPSVGADLADVKLWVTLIFLDQEERTRFQESRHEYLIEQVQSTTQTVNTSAADVTVNFNFDHHVKELIWFATNSSMTDLGEYFNYTIGTGGSGGICLTWTASGAGGHQNADQVYPAAVVSSDVDITAAQFKFDNSDLFSDGAKNTRYFTQLQPMYHHTSVPWTPGIFVYSFALKPEEFQPSGTLDFTSITTQQLVITCGSSNYNNVTIMAVNYNVLVIAGGHGTLNI
tara:strand:- start:636 stop:1928 length:1293 start_codon:yes stop_codon:yes gene_type:complete